MSLPCHLFITVKWIKCKDRERERRKGRKEREKCLAIGKQNGSVGELEGTLVGSKD